MKFNLEKASGIRIHAYDPGMATLAIPAGLEFPQGAEPVTDDPSLCRISRNLIISSNTIHYEESPESYAALAKSHFEFALGFNPEILLLGTGNTIQFPAADLMSLPASRGVGLEVMDTAAACRTFNILVGENRQVVAILLMS
jgi:uncharacterized protein